MNPFSLVKILILIVLILIPSHTAAQGTSYIGLCSKSWPCDKTLSTWRGKPITVGLELSVSAPILYCGNLSTKRFEFILLMVRALETNDASGMMCSTDTR